MHNIDENEVLRDALSTLKDEVPPMPEGLHAAWMQQVTEDAREKRTDKRLTRKTLTQFLSFAAAMVFIVGGTLLTRDEIEQSTRDGNAGGYALTNVKSRSAEAGAGAPQFAEDDAMEYAAVVAENEALGVAAATSEEWDAAMARSYDAGAEPEGLETANALSADAAVPAEKKIIRSASMTIQTSAYEVSLSSLQALCEAEGGWIEYISEDQNSSTGLRTAWLTLRIPQVALDAYLTSSSDCGRVTSKSQSATDVTASWQDTRRRLDTQLALMAQLESLVPESATLADLLALEAQMAETQYKIDTLQESLRETDRHVTYSTVTIHLREETAPALTDGTVSLGERLSAGLRIGFDAIAAFFQDALVFVAAALPSIGIVAGVAVIVLIVRRITRRKKS